MQKVIIERDQNNEVCGFVHLEVDGKRHVLLFTLLREGPKVTTRFMHAKGSAHLTEDITRHAEDLTRFLIKATK